METVPFVSRGSGMVSYLIKIFILDGLEAHRDHNVSIWIANYKKQNKIEKILWRVG